MNFSRLAGLTLLVSTAVHAQDIAIVGNITQTIKIPATNKLQVKANSNGSTKEITLLKVQVSPHAKAIMAQRVANLSDSKTTLKATQTRLPSHVQLGMNNVPVLNQGVHGTCATFANTAAISAALDKGDYVSQLCQLQLGNYFQTAAYSPSGWDGSWGRFVLSQIEMFGFVSKAQQKANGCAGLTDYPTFTEGSRSEMTLAEFHPISEALPENVAWSPIVDVYQAFLKETDTNKAIQDIKQALNAGDRVTFGILLFDFNLGVMGAVGKHNVANDTWVMTPEIVHDIAFGSDFGGHEMIITGYDDNAIAVDDNGEKYKGLFTLRNSWGDDIGDKGDFYISYDYVKALLIEAQRIRQFEADSADSDE